SPAYSLAGNGVVFEISSVTRPRHSGSSGVTLTIRPQRAYVLFPTHTTSTSRGISMYSTVSARAKLLGGIKQYSASTSTNDRGSKFFGSTTAPQTLVNTWNLRSRRTS